MFISFCEGIDEDDGALENEVLDGHVLVVGLHPLEVGEGVQPAHDLPEHGVLAVQMLAGSVRNETEGETKENCGHFTSFTI